MKSEESTLDHPWDYTPAEYMSPGETPRFRTRPLTESERQRLGLESDDPVSLLDHRNDAGEWGHYSLGAGISPISPRSLRRRVDRAAERLGELEL